MLCRETSGSQKNAADGLQVSSYRRRAAYDVLPVRAATMIRGIAWASAAVTASATIALNSHVSVNGDPSAASSGPSGGGTGAALALEEHVLMRNFRISAAPHLNAQTASLRVLSLGEQAIPLSSLWRARRCPDAGSGRRPCR